MSFIKPKTLIASCQAVKGEALYGNDIMHLMAKAVISGGADGIRACYTNDINSIRKQIGKEFPIIGIIKAVYADSDVYITPTSKEVNELLNNTDCQIIALDFTTRMRPNDEKIDHLVKMIKSHTRKVEIMADCSTFEECQNAEKLGVDYIGTTLRGYTAYTKGIKIPDINFLRELTTKLSTKIIAEGGIWEIEQLKDVLSTDVYAVVIGSSITRPADITKRFKDCFNK